jgi:hypothetical protein
VFLHGLLLKEIVTKFWDKFRASAKYSKNFTHAHRTFAGLIEFLFAVALCFMCSAFLFIVIHPFIEK